jgi:hypothetical protein
MTSQGPLLRGLAKMQRRQSTSRRQRPRMPAVLGAGVRRRRLSEHGSQPTGITQRARESLVGGQSPPLRVGPRRWDSSVGGGVWFGSGSGAAVVLDSEERVVGDRGGHVTHLILRVRPEHREHESGRAVTALPAIERTLPVGHFAPSCHDEEPADPSPATHGAAAVSSLTPDGGSVGHWPP